jgi:hypothetical protein
MPRKIEYATGGKIPPRVHGSPKGSRREKGPETRLTHQLQIHLVSPSTGNKDKRFGNRGSRICCPERSN